jgi:hypothetical protein
MKSWCRRPYYFAALLAVLFLWPASECESGEDVHQKLVYVTGSNSVLMLGDALLKGGSMLAAGHNVLPSLLEEGWRVVSIHIVEIRDKQTVSGYVLLERAASPSASGIETRATD